MKTPDEIKKGLECCTVEYCYHTQKGCPYRDYSLCVQNVCADALAYIQQLERERNKLIEKFEQMELERDAAARDLSMVSDCNVCGNHAWNGGNCFGLNECGQHRPRWQWRGVQKEVE